MAKNKWVRWIHLDFRVLKGLFHYAPETFKMWCMVHISNLGEINFGKIWISKIAICTISDTLNWTLIILGLEEWLKLKSKFRSAKNDISWPFELAKIWFHVKSKWQANCKISTPGCLNFTFWKFLEHSGTCIYKSLILFAFECNKNR